MNTQHIFSKAFIEPRRQYERRRKRYGISHMLAGLFTLLLGTAVFESPAFLRFSVLSGEVWASTILACLAGGIGLVVVGLMWMDEGWYGGFNDMLYEWFD